MSNLKISDLPAATSVQQADLVPVVDTSGSPFVTKKATVEQLLASTQPSLAMTRMGYWVGAGNITNSLGLIAPTVLGTLTARGVATTSLLEATRRTGYVSTAAVNALCGWRLATLQLFQGSTAAYGMIKMNHRFAVSDAVLVAGAQTFIGLRSVSTAAGLPADPSTFVNCIGVGQDATDVNWQIMHNDAAGTATRINTGIPVNITSLLELQVLMEPGTGVAVYQFSDLSTGTVVSGTINTNLPAADTLLTPNCFRSPAASATAVGLDLVSLYVETST